MYVFVIVWYVLICLTIHLKGFIFNTKNSKVLFAIRRINQCIVFFIPLSLYKIKIMSCDINFPVLLLCIIIPVLYWCINRNSFVLITGQNEDILFESVPVTVYLINIIASISMLIGEEVFFRGLVLSIYGEINTYFAVIVNSVLFCILHYMQQKSQVSVKKVSTQLFFSIMFSLFTLMGEGIIYSIIAHTLYNGPFLIRLINDLRGELNERG